MARTSNTGERRAQIAGALRRVMAKKGYDGASIADVAAEAELTAGLVHYHFGSKLEILLAVLEGLAAAHEAAVAEAVARCEGDPLAEVGAFIDAHLALGASADPEALACWVMLAGEALREARVRAAFEAVLARLVARLVEVLRRGAKVKVLSARKPDAAAAAIVAAIQGYFILAATARELIPRGSAAPAVRAMAAGLLEAPALAAPRAKRRVRT